MPSKIIILDRALNFEVMQTLYITFLIAFVWWKKEGFLQNMFKPKN